MAEKEGTSTDRAEENACDGSNRLSDSTDETDEAPNAEGVAEEEPAPTDELEEFAAGRGNPPCSL